jgi:hypothetical protein
MTERFTLPETAVLGVDRRLSRERLDRLCREILDPPKEERAVGSGDAACATARYRLRKYPGGQAFASRHQ